MPHARVLLRDALERREEARSPPSGRRRSRPSLRPGCRRENIAMRLAVSTAATCPMRDAPAVGMVVLHVMADGAVVDHVVEHDHAVVHRRAVRLDLRRRQPVDRRHDVVEACRRDRTAPASGSTGSRDAAPPHGCARESARSEAARRARSPGRGRRGLALQRLPLPLEARQVLVGRGVLGRQQLLHRRPAAVRRAPSRRGVPCASSSVVGRLAQQVVDRRGARSGHARSSRASSSRPADSRSAGAMASRRGRNASGPAAPPNGPSQASSSANARAARRAAARTPDAARGRSAATQPAASRRTGAPPPGTRAWPGPSSRAALPARRFAGVGEERRESRASRCRARVEPLGRAARSRASPG